MAPVGLHSNPNVRRKVPVEVDAKRGGLEVVVRWELQCAERLWHPAMEGIRQEGNSLLRYRLVGVAVYSRYRMPYNPVRAIDVQLMLLHELSKLRCHVYLRTHAPHNVNSC